MLQAVQTARRQYSAKVIPLALAFSATIVAAGSGRSKLIFFIVLFPSCKPGRSGLVVCSLSYSALAASRMASYTLARAMFVTMSPVRFKASLLR